MKTVTKNAGREDGVLIALLFLFALSIPFEALPLTSGVAEGENSVFTISKGVAVLLFSWVAIKWTTLPRKWDRVAVAFLVFFLFAIFSDLVGGLEVAGQLMLFVSCVQLYVSYVLLVPVFRSERLRGVFVVGFSLGGALSAGLMVAGVTVYDNLPNSAGGRMTAFNVDPNAMAFEWAICAVMSLAVVFQQYRCHWAIRIASGLGLVPVLLAIVGTASRSGLLILCLGVVCFSLLSARERGMRIKVLLAMALIMVGVVEIALQSQVLMVRLQGALETGDLSSRDLIWRNAGRVLEDSPFIGYGLSGHLRELARASGLGNRILSSHNTFFAALLIGGMLGGLPFVYAWLEELRRAWDIRNIKDGALLITLIVMMTSLSMTIDYMNRKSLWIVFAMVTGAWLTWCSVYYSRRVGCRQPE